MNNQLTIPAGDAELTSNLLLPMQATGLVVFAHEGNHRLIDRSQLVADLINQAGLGVLLVDLLTAEEQTDELAAGKLLDDIPLQAERLIMTLDWLGRQSETRDLQFGLLGAGRGAATAMMAAASRPDRIRALACRGGRLDLAAEVLHHVRAPTLLMVGSHDEKTITINREAMAELGGESRIEIIPGATHLFQEAGKLESVARLSRAWFEEHLTARD